MPHSETPAQDNVSADNIPLHRLLKRREAEALLGKFGTLLPENNLAIIRANGQLFAGKGEWSQAELAIRLAQAADGQIVSAADFDLYPLLVGGHLVGALVGDSSAPENVLCALHRSLTMILAQALEKRDIARETLERYHEINLLYHIGETIGACLNSEEIPDMLLAETNRVIQTDASMVLLTEAKDEGDLTIAASSGTVDPVRALYQAAPYLTEHNTGQADIVVSGPIDAGPPVDTGPFETILYAPLKTQARMLGMLLLGRLRGQPIFTAGDRKLVVALTSQAAIAIEKAWLHQQEIKRQRLEEELSIGRQIQLSLLPAACPTLPGWEIAATYQAARQVGGDLYDFFELPGQSQRLGLVIADVTGKGVPAAMFMAVSRTIIRAESMTGRNPAAVLQRANRLIAQDSRSRLFLSTFYATLDIGSGRLVYANGGHDWPLWLQAATGKCQELDAQGIILGAFKEIEVEERAIDVAPGDFLIFYTDGITEARNAKGELFGEVRLQTTVAANPKASAGQMVQTIFEAVKSFVGDTPPSDDFTLFVVKRQKTASS